MRLPQNLAHVSKDKFLAQLLIFKIILMIVCFLLGERIVAFIPEGSKG